VLLGKSAEELAALAQQLGQAAYRGQQIRAALLAGARSLDQMTSLSRPFRDALAAAGARTGRSVLHHSVGAEDGTRKFLLQLGDGRVVEAVGIPADEGGKNRLTVCVSSQVGCARGGGCWSRCWWYPGAGSARSRTGRGRPPEALAAAAAAAQPSQPNSLLPRRSAAPCAAPSAPQVGVAARLRPWSR
jgi:hypothetical protein